MKFLVIKTNLPLLVILVFRGGKLDFQYKIRTYLILKLTVKKHWNMIIILGEGRLIVHFDSSKTKVFSVWKIKMKKYRLPQ